MLMLWSSCSLWQVAYGNLCNVCLNKKSVISPNVIYDSAYTNKQTNEQTNNWHIAVTSLETFANKSYVCYQWLTEKKTMQWSIMNVTNTLFLSHFPIYNSRFQLFYWRLYLKTITVIIFTICCTKFHPIKPSNELGPWRIVPTVIRLMMFRRKLRAAT